MASDPSPEVIAEVERLLRSLHWQSIVSATSRVIQSDRDQISALNARVAELEGALEPFAKEGDFWIALKQTPDGAPIGGNRITVGDLRKARAALTKKDDSP